MIDLIDYHKGLCIKGTPLWMDAQTPKELCFVSHAHSDHLAYHTKIISTPQTARLYRHRYGQKNEALISPYNRVFTLGNLRMELFPAGHCLGAAQIDIEKKGKHIVYTGDFSLQPGLTTPAAQIKRCDYLIIESTYGHPRYVFPKKEHVRRDILFEVNRILNDGGVPCFFTYSLGRSQEIIKLLTQANYKVRVHSSIYAISRIYNQFGIDLGPVEQYYRSPDKGDVLIFPYSALGSSGLSRISGLRKLVVTGLAVELGYAKKFGVDKAFPLSDHADFNELITYVEKARPRKVLTIYGHHETLARYLRERNFNATALNPSVQLELFD